MKRRTGIAMLLGLCLPAAAEAGALFDEKTLSFLDRIDAHRLGLLPVQYKGRIGILDTLARDLVGQACGDESIHGVAPAAAMLELYFNAGAYLRKPVLYVRERRMQGFVARHLHGQTGRQFQQTRRFPPGLVMSEEAALALLRAGRATPQQCLAAAEPSDLGKALGGLTDRPEFRVPVERLNVRFSSFLAESVFRPVPLDDGETWATAEEVLIFDIQLPGGRMPTGLVLRYRLFAPMLQAHREGRHKQAAELAEMTEKMLQAVEDVRARHAAATRPADDPDAKYLALYRDFVGLRDAWRARDADKVNAIVARLGEGLTALRKEIPSRTFRSLERLYNQTYSGTIVWIGFAAALVLSIVAAAVPHQRPYWYLAMAVLSLSTAALAGGFVVRWVVSGRAWYLPPIMNQFEAVIGSAMLAALLAVCLEIFWKKSYFALSGAFYATVSLLCGFFLPEQMGAAIKAQHGILASPIMAVHVAVIIVGHALVGMTFVISMAYLIALMIRGFSRDPAGASTGPDLSGGATEGTLASIDRCNLIVAQLACLTVAAGTILGAYWADFAWARWWGWDRKETWALITSLVYIGIVHVRFVTPRRWRGLVTACCSIAGCGAMLFNWIYVNYYLAGMHSYA